VNSPGYDALWHDFGLSRAAFLVMPRALMHEMPDEWQAKMAELLSDWHAAWDWPNSIGVPIVQNSVDGKFAKWPDYILNYRHPQNDAINSIRTKP